MSQPSLPEALNHWRRKRGLTASALADQAGIHRTTWARWMSGRFRPSASELETVFRVLDLPAADRTHCWRQLDAPRALVHLRRETSDLPLSDLLRALRQRARLTQADTARQAGITQGLLGRWECGFALPNTERLHTLCFVLGASAEETAALTLGAFRAQEPLPDDAEELYSSFQMFIYHESIVNDLPFLAYGARFLHLIRNNQVTHEYLAKVWGRQAHHVQWRLGRNDDAIQYGNAALSLTAPTTALDGHLTATVIAIAQAWQEKSGPRAAFEYLRQWQERAVENPVYRHWIQCNIARYLSDTGETEAAVRMGAGVFAEALRFGEEWAGDFLNRRWDYVHLLLKDGKGEVALDVMEKYPVRPHTGFMPSEQIHEMTLLAEARFQAGESQEASRLRDDIHSLARQHPLSRSEQDRFTRLIRLLQ